MRGTQVIVIPATHRSRQLGALFPSWRTFRYKTVAKRWAIAETVQTGTEPIKLKQYDAQE